ncbi:EVE domain-containing protein [Cryobacterium zongtaii]|uniref:EVE domain-containing protein n=1 Tax=Cryobacterium zongtaii TaxID=1259217 RepID=UPI001FAFD7AC|nr:EVE domain-containing protein [Cryobacterium zongtaii]
MAIRYWLGVVQQEYVLRSVAMGLAQMNFAAREILESMNESDGLVYYSPKTEFEGERLRQFTAIGYVSDNVVVQVGDSGSEYRPWRRRVQYDPDAEPASIRPLLKVLDLTRDDPDWGRQLRRGLLEISRHDFDLIRAQMRRPSADDRRR